MTAGNFLVEDWQRRHKAAKEYVLHLQTVLGRAAHGSDSDRIERLRNELKAAQLDAGLCEARLCAAQEAGG